MAKIAFPQIWIDDFLKVVALSSFCKNKTIPGAAVEIKSALNNRHSHDSVISLLTTNTPSAWEKDSKRREKFSLKERPFPNVRQSNQSFHLVSTCPMSCFTCIFLKQTPTKCMKSDSFAEILHLSILALIFSDRQDCPWELSIYANINLVRNIYAKVQLVRNIEATRLVMAWSQMLEREHRSWVTLLIPETGSA